MAGFLAEYLKNLRDPRVYGTWLVATAAATAAGPFGTYTAMPLSERAAYWGGVIGLSILVALAVRPTIRRWWPDSPDWVETLRVSAAFTLVYTPMLVAITLWNLEPGETLSMSPLRMAAVVFAVPWAAFVARRILAEDPEAGPARGIEPRLLRRLQNGAREVRRLSGRDHYVDVFTDRGKTSVLMRFADAVAELEGAPGLQVHRSHWVAATMVERVDRAGAQLFLRLKCGSRIPVSRRYRAAVESSDLLAPALRPGTGTARSGSHSRIA